jgi:hypothetical protein
MVIMVLEQQGTQHTVLTHPALVYRPYPLVFSDNPENVTKKKGAGKHFLDSVKSNFRCVHTAEREPEWSVEYMSKRGALVRVETEVYERKKERRLPERPVL